MKADLISGNPPRAQLNVIIRRLSPYDEIRPQGIGLIEFAYSIMVGSQILGNGCHKNLRVVQDTQFLQNREGLEDRGDRRLGRARTATIDDWTLFVELGSIQHVPDKGIFHYSRRRRIHVQEEKHGPGCGGTFGFRKHIPLRIHIHGIAAGRAQGTSEIFSHWSLFARYSRDANHLEEPLHHPVPIDTLC
jgi:hypothetical protein